MTVQPVVIATPKHWTDLKTAFLCISRYNMLQLTTCISNTLRNEQAKNTTMNDFARCTNIQQKLILFKNLCMLSKLQGKVLQKLPFFRWKKDIYWFSSVMSPFFQFQKITFSFTTFCYFFFISLNNIKMCKWHFKKKKRLLSNKFD